MNYREQCHCQLTASIERERERENCTIYTVSYIIYSMDRVVGLIAMPPAATLATASSTPIYTFELLQA
jgi:hypothetical protein